MDKITIRHVRRYLPSRMMVCDRDASLSRIDLRDVDVSYDSGRESGVERLTLHSPGGYKTVIYGFERLPGSVPATLRPHEHRASSCRLRWEGGEECNLDIFGVVNSLSGLYMLIVDGIRPDQGDN